jgi:hypothetical protein
MVRYSGTAVKCPDHVISHPDFLQGRDGTPRPGPNLLTDLGPVRTRQLLEPVLWLRAELIFFHSTVLMYGVAEVSSTLGMTEHGDPGPEEPRWISRWGHGFYGLYGG